MTALAYAATYPGSDPPDDGSRERPPRLADCELLRPLGRGGCAVVYEARHPLYGSVAVKIGELPKEGIETGDRRLMREAELTARVVHPNVLRIFDAGRTADGSPYLVMERLHGADLESTLSALGLLTLPTACEIVRQVLIALEAVHRAGIVHRDLKPTNVMLDVPYEGATPRVKLIDFGVARGSEGEKLTRTGVVIGTPQYLSPEQARGGAFDHRVDVWAAGVLLHELLVGHSPFDRYGVHETLAAILFGDLPDVRTLRPEVPERLALVLSGALAREPEDRFASADAMREALEAAALHHGIDGGPEVLSTLPVPRASDPVLDDAPRDATPLSPSSGVRRIGRCDDEAAPSRRVSRRGLALSAGAVAIVLGLVSGTFALGAALAESAPLTHHHHARAKSKASKGAAIELATPSAAELRVLRRQHARDDVARARLAFQSGSFDAAYSLYDEATRADPGYAPAWLGLHDAAARLGRHAEARAALRRHRALTERPSPFFRWRRR